MGFDRSTGNQNLGTGCGYWKENGVVVWCVHCSVSFQPIELRHLVIAPFHNTKKLLVVSMQSRFDTSRFDAKSFRYKSFRYKSFRYKSFRYKLKQWNFEWISSFFKPSTWNYLHLEWINLYRNDRDRKSFVSKRQITPRNYLYPG